MRLFPLPSVTCNSRVVDMPLGYAIHSLKKVSSFWGNIFGPQEQQSDEKQFGVIMMVMQICFQSIFFCSPVRGVDV